MSYSVNYQTSNAFATSMRNSANVNVVPGGKGEGMVESTSPIHTYNACLQSTTKEDCIDRYHQAYLYAKQTDDAQYLVNLNIALLQKRRIRNGGEGLRDHFHTLYAHIYKTYPDQREFILSLVPYIPHVGYFRDYWSILREINTYQKDYTNLHEFYTLFNPLVSAMVTSYISYLRKDMEEKETNESPKLSLAAKYFPRPKKEEDRNISWFIPIQSKTAITKPNQQRYHKRSLTHYLTIAYYSSHYLEGITQSQIENKEIQLVPNHIQKKMRLVYTSLCETLDIPERKMSSINEEWSDLKLEEMTSRCFMRNLQALKNKMNKKGHKHEVRHPYSKDRIKCAENTQKYLISGKITQGNTDIIDLTRRIRNSTMYETDQELEAIYQSKVIQTLKDVIIYYTDLNHKARDPLPSPSPEGEETPPPPPLQLQTDTFYQNLSNLEELRQAPEPDREEIQRVVDLLKETEFLHEPKLLEEYFKSIKTKTNNEIQKELLEITRFFVRGVVPCMDVSGSMTIQATETASCMDICVALGVLFTYVNPGPFQDLAVSFTDIPRMFNFSGLTVKQRLNKVFQHVGYNTNLEKALQLILDTASNGNVPPDQLPDLVIFSDGNFDQMMRFNDITYRTAFQKYTKMFQEAGYEMPQIYFWNLNGTQRNFQALPTRKGVSQLNGFTPSCFQQILTGDKVLETLPEQLQEQEEQGNKPQKSMEDDFQGMVNQSYWDFVRLLANNCQQGLYASYTFEVTEEVLSHHSMVMDMLSYEEDHEPPRPLSAPPAINVPEHAAEETPEAAATPEATPEATPVKSGSWLPFW